MLRRELNFFLHYSENLLTSTLVNSYYEAIHVRMSTSVKKLCSTSPSCGCLEMCSELNRAQIV